MPSLWRYTPTPKRAYPTRYDVPLGELEGLLTQAMAIRRAIGEE